MKVKFTDCVDFVGQSCNPFENTKSYVSTGAVGIDYINQSEIESVKFDSKPSRANLEVSCGDILFAKMQGTKKLLIIDEKRANNVYSTGFCAVRAKKNVITPKCLYYILISKSFLNQKDKNCSGATQKAITNSGLRKIIIDIPPYEKQERIAEQLDRAITIIKFRQQELLKLDELIKARFVEMFGDPVANPKGWEQVTVGDVCSSIVRGPFGSALKKEFFVEPSNKTYKVYEQKHAIQKNATIGTYYVTEEKYQELKRFECVPGDIIMSCSGTMGELYQLPEGCERGIINQALCKFTLNDKMLPICFLTYMRQTIGNLETKGSGIKNIAAVSYVKAMPINLPPKQIQKEYELFCKQVGKSKIAVQNALDETQLLFDSLMQKYFG